MGWTYFEKPFNVSEWYKDFLTWESDKKKYTCLKTVVKFKEAYAAVEVFDKETNKRYVFASVFMLNYTRERHYNFGYKGMDESMGPNISNCPASILNLLTPVDEMPWSESMKEWAKAWRERCFARVNMPKLKFGDKIEFLGDFFGFGRVFEKVRYNRRRNVFRSETGGLVSISRSQLMAYNHKVL